MQACERSELGLVYPSFAFASIKEEVYHLIFVSAELVAYSS